jgi:hypothetical protein
MRKSHRFFLCSILVSASATAQPAVQPASAVSVAQPPQIQPSSTVAAAPAPAAILAPLPTNRAILRAGTEVPVRLVEEVTTKGKKLHVGQRVRMETADALVYQGMIVVPANSPVTGEITDVVNKGMWGKSGHVSLRVLYVTVNGRQIRLSGAIDDKGVAGGVAAVAVSAVVFLPAGFFMTGTSAKLPVGTAFKAFLDEDLTLEIAPSAPPPLMIGASAVPVPVTTAAAPPASASPSAAGGAQVVPVAMLAPSNAATVPVPALPPGPPRAAANTPSGYCLDVPKDYVGTGSTANPVLTAAMPACSSLGRK